MPAPRQLGKDTGLQARMLLTLFLLGLVYAVLVGVHHVEDEVHRVVRGRLRLFLQQPLAAGHELPERDLPDAPDDKTQAKNRHRERDGL